MSVVLADLGMSLDGFVAGPNAGPDNGRRMFDEGEVGWPDPPPFRPDNLQLEITRVAESPAATHLWYRVTGGS